MRTTCRRFVVLAFVVALAAVSAAAHAAAIEAVKGKHYKLTKRHGPWMIMVCSFNAPPEELRTEGLTPAQAADELVYELRRKGIPAYTFSQDEIEGRITTVSRRTREEREAKVRSWTGGICVLAGNYPAANDPLAQKTLKYIKDKKRFLPGFLSEVAAEGAAGPGEVIQRSKSGGVFHITHDRPSPLSGAFMTTNPLLSDEDLAVRTHDPLILQLNSASDYSLLQNKGKYTVVVATFQGRSQNQLTHETQHKQFEVGTTALSEAAERAWELCTSLRHAKSLGYDRDYDAYVFHDHYSSIVTVGSFRSKDDPRIIEIKNTFGAKVTAVKDGAIAGIGAEMFSVPKKPVGDEPVKRWIFDPYPQLIDVPK